MTQRKKAPSLFIQKKKPPVKPVQSSVDYLSERRGPTVLDADKIAKMDTILEKQDINTLKGPKKATAKKDFELPAPQADVPKPAISPKKAQQPLAAIQPPKKMETPDKAQKSDMVDKMDESPTTITEMVQKPVIKQKRDVAPIATTDVAQKSIEYKKKVIQKVTVKEMHTPIINHKENITANVTIEQAQKPVVAQEKSVTTETTVDELQKPKTTKPGIRKRVTSLLKARKPAVAQLKGSLSRMRLPQAPSTSSSSVPAAESPKATRPKAAINLESVAAPSRTLPQASISLLLSPVAIAPQTPPQAAIPLPESPIGTELDLLTAASIALPLSPISPAPKTSLRIEIPRPQPTIDAGPKTPPEALIPLLLSPMFNISSMPPADAIPLPASPTTEWKDVSPQTSTLRSVLLVEATPQTPLQPALSFPFTPETTTSDTAFRHLDAPLVKTPKFARHVASVFPPTPDTDSSQRPRALPTTWSHTPMANASKERLESLPLYLPTPETQVPVVAPLAAAFCSRTPETPAPWIHPQVTSVLTYTPKPLTPKPRDLWLLTTPTRDEWGMTTSCSVFRRQTRRNTTPNIYPQVTSALPQIPPNPPSEICGLGEPMALSSAIYHMSPGHSIHETPDLAEFLMSCIPKFSDPLPDWELYFNKNLANTISAFSANCRFEHPGANRQNSNPFSALAGGGNNSRGGFGRPTGSEGPQFSLNKDTIYKDLTEERPSWALSAYGPGRDAPEQLWGGYPIEQSFEEARLHFVMGQLAGNPQGAVSSLVFESPDNRLTLHLAQ